MQAPIAEDPFCTVEISPWVSIWEGFSVLLSLETSMTSGGLVRVGDDGFHSSHHPRWWLTPSWKRRGVRYPDTAALPLL